MLVLRVDLNSPTPVYRQIADGLRAALVDGDPAPGEKLPPVRQLAMDLGVHHNTVAEAYRLLSDEDWLNLVQGRGAVVCERRLPRAGEPSKRRFARRLRLLLAEARGEGVRMAWRARQLDREARRLGAEKGGG
ncbi:MAG: GntR family transcriptional regulator [Acidobacteriota bacterium]